MTTAMRYSPADLSAALGLFPPTDEQAAVIAAPPGPLVVIAGAGAGKTETMASRVVWLVANGYAMPSQVLGLTFTRKAAGQLLRRVRTRLARLAGAGLVLDLADEAAEPATVSTYDAFAGTLLREHGLLLPVEPDTRLISETERWQLAFDVVCAHPGELAIDKTPAAVTRMVLSLAGALAEHLVDTDQLRDTHLELERLVHTLPAGPYQRDTGPNQWLRNILANQTERTELVPLIDALHRRMQAEKVMDFGMQMSAAARLAAGFPQVGEQLRQRFRVVLLDEYQDTGHAQRVALSALFGGGVDDGLALTAVGDPIQSIYGWRGASATNLPRFTTDFPLADGRPAPTLELRTSWRNPPSALHLANAVSAEARRRSVTVHELRPRPGAEPGDIRCALLPDVETERAWVADHLAQIHHRDDGTDPPTAAVLVRRNADAAPMAEALTARGVPVEVVGVAGLLAVPEVADLVAMLRLVADPAAGPAVMRVLTGPRWRFGARDIAALWRRARELDDRPAGESSPAEIVAQAAPDADTACLADAICDPGVAEHYSVTGYQRIEALGRELTLLRAHLSHPLPELVAEVRRVTGVDAEARANRPVAAGWSGTENLDAFCDLVADYAGRPEASVLALLAYLDVAIEQENGLTPAEPTVSPGRVQILTVHAAKGLEWNVVAVPHLSGRVFPSKAAARTWLTDPAELPPLLRGDRATESELGVPVLDVSDITDRKMLTDRIGVHKDRLAQRRIDEERRLLYVAVTRSEDTLLISGHHWGATESKPRGPSEFLCEIKTIMDDAAAAGQPCGTIEQWAPDPSAGEQNPLRDKVVEEVWPAEPARRSDVERGADLVSRAWQTGGQTVDVDTVDPDPEGWAADVDALLAERDRPPSPAAPVLPGQLSVSTLVELSRDRTAALQRLQRRLPQRPDPHALLGTAFHEWVQRYFHSERLFDLDDLPGAVDGDSGQATAAALSELQDAFMRSPWAARTPIEVEVPFDMAIGHPATTVVRGRIDAVFADDDGATTVVDWKTGEPPSTPEAMSQAAVQLAVYRLAWARLRGCAPESVHAAFHYVRSGQTVTPESLPGEDELAALLTDGRPNG